MKKAIIPEQLSLHFEEVHDSLDNPLTDGPVLALALLGANAPEYKYNVVNLERFIHDRDQSDKDRVYRQILDSVRLI